MTFLPLYNIFLFHTPHPHKGDGLTAVPFVFCFFNHPPGTPTPALRSQLGSTNAPAHEPRPLLHTQQRNGSRVKPPAAKPLPPRRKSPPTPTHSARQTTPTRQPPPRALTPCHSDGPPPAAKHHPAPHRLLAPQSDPAPT